jgi:hypothetical protein
MINQTYDSFAASASPFYYWDFLVNGNTAQTGIDNTLINAGDTISFGFEPYEVVKHGNSTFVKKHALRTAAYA